MDGYVLFLIIGMILGLVFASSLHTKKNYHRSYDGLLQLSDYKKKTKKEKEVVKHIVNPNLYFTVEAFFGNVEIKVYTNATGEMKCVETVEADIWNQSNSLVKFKSQYKKEIENYLLEERQKMFKNVKEMLTT